jgi:peptidyl-prolyl cis-trans isomerase B (cyclophilin B)
MVIIEMENGKKIKIELYPEVAPITVENFEKLVKEGFYDGLIFHRVIKGFMIQGGDPEGTGMGGSDTNIKGEFAVNGVANNISHVRGVISMARARSYNSASSQFFIVHRDSTYLDGQYAAFGRVIEGMEVVDAIAEVPTNGNDRPLTEQVIETIRVVEE